MQYWQIYKRVRPHGALGYRPPAPETIRPEDPVPALVGSTKQVVHLPEASQAVISNNCGGRSKMPLLRDDTITRFQMGPRKLIAMTVLALAVPSIACTAPTEIREVEVTREVSVIQEIPVTVEVLRDVEVTREVTVPQEVPVTVETIRDVEVTREVVTVERVEVTREVPVTRLVETADPVVPTTEPTSAQAITTPSPEPTPAPTLAAETPTATPTPSQSRFGYWTMSNVTYGNAEMTVFQNTAQDYQSGPQPPILSYYCDTRGGRAMYIDWHHTLAGAETGINIYAEDPFREYRDNDLYAIIDYADSITEFVDELELSRSEQRKLEENWNRIRLEWLGHQTTATDLIDRMDTKNHRSVWIELVFFEEPDKVGIRYGYPQLGELAANWIVLSDRTQMNHSSIGELRSAHRNSFVRASKRQMMSATVRVPEQPIIGAAKWNISGLNNIFGYCRGIRP